MLYMQISWFYILLFYFIVTTEFLLYSQQTSIRGRILNNVAPGFKDVILPIRSKNAKFVALDFDAHENYIYFSDVHQGLVYRINKNGTGKPKWEYL